MFLEVGTLVQATFHTCSKTWQDNYSNLKYVKWNCGIVRKDKSRLQFSFLSYRGKWAVAAEAEREKGQIPWLLLFIDLILLRSFSSSWNCPFQFFWNIIYYMYKTFVTIYLLSSPFVLKNHVTITICKNYSLTFFFKWKELSFPNKTVFAWPALSLLMNNVDFQRMGLVEKDESIFLYSSSEI